MQAGCLPRLIGINCVRLQSRTESLTLAASQHFFLIVLMITTRADDHCGALIVRRAALQLFPVGTRAGLSPSALRVQGEMLPRVGWGCGGMDSRVPMCPEPPRGWDAARHPVKLSGKGTERTGEGTAAPCPPGGRAAPAPALPMGERWLWGGTRNIRRENVPHPEAPLGQRSPQGCPTLAVPEGKHWATLLPWAPHQLPESRPHRVPQEGLGVLPREARRGESSWQITHINSRAHY